MLFVADQDLDFTNTSDGWYRLLVDPVDVIVQCNNSQLGNQDGDVLARGSAKYEILYSTDSESDVIAASGMHVNSYDPASVACAGPYPKNDGGAISGIMVDIPHKLTT